MASARTDVEHRLNAHIAVTQRTHLVTILRTAAITVIALGKTQSCVRVPFLLASNAMNSAIEMREPPVDPTCNRDSL